MFEMAEHHLDFARCRRGGAEACGTDVWKRLLASPFTGAGAEDAVRAHTVVAGEAAGYSYRCLAALPGDDRARCPLPRCQVGGVEEPAPVSAVAAVVAHIAAWLSVALGRVAPAAEAVASAVHRPWRPHWLVEAAAPRRMLCVRCGTRGRTAGHMERFRCLPVAVLPLRATLALRGACGL